MRISIQSIRKLMIVITALVLTAILASGLPFFMKRVNQQTPVEVTVAPVSAVNKSMRIQRPGTVVQAMMFPVYSEGAGLVSNVYVRTGQVVKAGQPLVMLEITSAGRSEGDVPMTTPKPPAVREDSSVGKEAYLKALKEYNLCKKLYEQGDIARKELETVQARLQAAQASMQTQQVVVEEKVGETVEENTVVNGPVTIQASMDGTVTGNVVSVGSAIQVGQELLALGSGQDVEMVVPLEQSELYSIQLGSSVVIEKEGQPLAGLVSGIYPEVKEKQIASFMAHIKLTQPSGNLLTPGMSANLSIATGQEVATIAVPTQAVLHDEDGRYFVFLAIDGKAIRQQVTIGEMIGVLRELTTAIPQDSLIITSQMDQLKNGDAIAVAQ